jgi:hypothetical protein
VGVVFVSAACIVGGCVGDVPTSPSVPNGGGGLDAGAGSDAETSLPREDAGDGATTCEGDRYGFLISNVDRCAVPPATIALDLGGTTAIDTTEGTLTTAGGTTSTLPGSIVWKQESGSELRIVAVTSLTIPTGTKIAVSGTRPLVSLSPQALR